jgi:hypothetical protein
MTLQEPMTVATDYLLGAVTSWLAVKVLGNSARQKSRMFWGVAFVALAAGAFLGGTWHGFVQSDLLWKATLFCVGVASFGMLVGSGYATLSGNARSSLIWVAALKLALFSFTIVERDDFLVVIGDTGLALAAVLALHLWKWNGWLVAGVAVSVLAALAQASGFALHAHFNHNDLYHVIQLAAMALLYRGARRLTDSVALG